MPEERTLGEYICDHDYCDLEECRCPCHARYNFERKNGTGYVPVLLTELQVRKLEFRLLTGSINAYTPGSQLWAQQRARYRKLESIWAVDHEAAHLRYRIRQEVLAMRVEDPATSALLEFEPCLDGTE